MNIHPWLMSTVLLALTVSGRAADVATVSQSKVNVRGQPSMAGEVITQLNKGDQVTVLENVSLEKPKAGEPAKWAKIKMPANTPVWVFASFVDPATKTVAARRLNLRAGPGENYSSIGRLQKGDAVKEIRVVDDCMEVETPESSFAFVAANSLDRAQGLPVETKTPDPEKTPPPAISITNAPIILPPESVPAPVPTPVDVKPEVTTPPLEPLAVATPPPVESKPTLTPEPAKPKVEIVPRRIVRREGIVRSTASIQAPTYTELISAETRRTLDWLHGEKSGISFKEFRGLRVIVTGEEGIDPRWPKTPVIEVETIQLAP